jgi:TetR/AcrR family transcriptional regulator, fatty acid metabolism regulator protein
MAKAHPQDKRARILEGALKVLAAKGFYNTKVSEIAREAGVADGTIYNYFKSKDDILISLFEDRMDWILRRLEEELAGDVVAQVKRYIELHLSLAIAEPELAEFITVELRQSDKFLREYRNPRFSDYLRVLSNLIERGQAEGVFSRALDSKVASRAIFGALDEILLTLTWGHSGTIEVAAVVDQVVSLVLRGLLRREGDD